MKVVLHAQFGGFDLEYHQGFLEKLKAVDDFRDLIVENESEPRRRYLFKGDQYILREHPETLRILKEMDMLQGDERRSHKQRYSYVEIPDHFKSYYLIQEYDGLESIDVEYTKWIEHCNTLTDPDLFREEVNKLLWWKSELGL